MSSPQTTTLRFEHESLAQRVVFATGDAALALRREVERLGATRVLVVAGPLEAPLADRLCAEVPVAARFTDVQMHVPVTVAEAARRAARECAADLVVSVGGGSATGTAKAVALTTGLPIVAVPTTYAGSEATPVWGLTEAGRKTTGTDPRVLPAVIVYDPVLTVTLPVDLSIASGLNALAHCVDSLWAPRANPISSSHAVEAMRALVAALPAVRADGGDLDARAQLLYGAYLGAVAFAAAGSGMHHKICHVLGGAYDLPHAPMHAVVLPHVLAYNAPAAPDAARRIADALGAEDPIDGIVDLYDRLDAPRSLADLGLAEADLPEAVRLVAEAVPSSNPRPVDLDALESLLRDAWVGRPPARNRHLETR